MRVFVAGASGAIGRPIIAELIRQGHTDQVRKRELAIIGAGGGVWSWVHIEDAAVATVAALTAPAGVYHVVDDNPSPVSRWLPAFARWVGAPAPPQLDGTAGPRKRRRGRGILRHEAPRRGKWEGEADSELRAPAAAMVGPMTDATCYSMLVTLSIS